MSYETNPYSIRPDLHTTLDSTTMTYLRISAAGIPQPSYKTTHTYYGDGDLGQAGSDYTKIPVYSIQTEDISFSATMVIDYNHNQPINITNTTFGTSNCDQSSGFRTVCGAVSLNLNDQFKEISSILTDSLFVGDFDLDGAPM